MPGRETFRHPFGRRRGQAILLMVVAMGLFMIGALGLPIDGYIMNGGGISFLAGGTSTGTGVTFYLTGTNASYGSVTANATANVTLTAPTSGTYRGILFFQDRSITSAMNATFATTGTLALTGSLYFPTTDVSFQGGAGTTSYITAIVANEITFTNNTYITNDSTGSNTGLSAGASAGLMQ
jgi:hypothetical protein